jgi:hypothetical protein
MIQDTYFNHDCVKNSPVSILEKLLHQFWFLWLQFAPLFTEDRSFGCVSPVGTSIEAVNVDNCKCNLDREGFHLHIRDVHSVSICSCHSWDLNGDFLYMHVSHCSTSDGHGRWCSIETNSIHLRKCHLICHLSLRLGRRHLELAGAQEPTIAAGSMFIAIFMIVAFKPQVGLWAQSLILASKQTTWSIFDLFQQLVR